MTNTLRSCDLRMTQAEVLQTVQHQHTLPWYAPLYFSCTRLAQVVAEAAAGRGASLMRSQT
jgi:hypothetical protein